MLKLTPEKRVLFVRRLASVLLVLFGVFSLTFANIARSPQIAHAAAANTINFQARLQTSTGAIVPDGNYNVEFKIYSASSGGSPLWTEDYLNGNGQGLQTINGYLSANLGSITAFSGINWDQQLWMTMNIGGTAGSGTFPTIGDGEMNPRLALTAVPYAFSAGQLNTTNGSNRSTLSILAPTGGNQTFQIQDQGGSGTFNILTAPSGSDGYVKLQGSSPGTQQTGSLNISGTVIAGTALQAPTFQTSDQTASSTNSSNVTFKSGAVSGATSNSGTVTVGSGASSTSGNTGTVTLSSGAATSGSSGNVSITSGAAAGSGKVSGNISIDVGAATSSATAGSIAIGATNAAAITITPATTINNTVAINNTSTTAFTITGSTNFVNVDTANNRFSIGATATCTIGRWCVAQNVTGSSNAVNQSNVMNINTASTGTNYVQKTTLSDTSTATAETNYAMYIDATGTTNASATTNGLFINNPSGLAGGNLIQLQTASSDVFKITNAGAATLTGSLTQTGGAISLTGNAASQISTSSSTLTLDAATTLNLGTSTATGVTLGSTSTTAAVLLQGTAGATYTIGTSNNTGGIIIGNSTAANTIAIGNAAATAAQTIAIGTGSTGAGSDLVTVGSTNGASSLTLQAGTGNFLVSGVAATTYTIGTTDNTGGITVGNSTASNTIAIGSAAGNGNTQTISIGASSTSGSTTNVNIGSSVGGTTAVTGPTTITNRTSGSSDSFTVSNSSSTGTIAKFLDGGSANPVFSLADGGAANFRVQTDATTAFRIQNAAGVSLLSWDSTANAAEKVTNGSFEGASTTGWANLSTGSISALSSHSLTGLYGTDGLYVAVTGNGQGAKYPIVLNTGTAYTLSFYSYASTTGGAGTFQFGYSSDGSTNTDCSGGATTFQNTGWTRYSCSFTTAGSVNGGAYLFMDEASGSATRNFYIDGVELEQTSSTNFNPYQESRAQINGIINGPLVLQNASNTTGAFQVYDASAFPVLNVDTLNDRVGIGLANPNATFSVSTTSGTNAAIPLVKFNQQGSAGDILDILGSTPASVAGTGTTPGAALNVVAQTGGATSGTSGQTAGAGGLVTLQGGTGGAATGTTGANTGGAGGALTLQGGTGGASASTNSSAVSGAGGAITLTTGTGGNTTAASGTSTAGAGGTFAIQGGTGGNATTAGIGGAGGSVTITAGNGGNGTGANANGGGGSITLTAGKAGTGGTGGSAGGVLVKGVANSSTAFQIQNASSVTIFTADTSNGRVIIGSGSTGNTTGYVLVLDNKTTSGDPTGVNGAMYYNASSSSFRCYENGVWRSCLGGLVNSSTAASSAISNTSTKTDFSGGTGNTYDILANDCQAGVTYRVTGSGVYSTTGTPNLTFSLDKDNTSTSLGTTGAMATGSGASNMGWQLSAQLICIDTTHVEVQGTVTVASATTGASTAVALFGNTGTQAWDTTLHTLKLGVTWDAQSSSNTITMRQFIVERMGP